MCGRSKRARVDEPRPQQHAYEGETVRFDRRTDGDLRSVARMQHFPWWTLWLIWPLIGVIKASAPVVLATLGAWGQISVPLLPLVLIAIGALVLLRHRSR